MNPCHKCFVGFILGTDQASTQICSALRFALRNSSCQRERVRADSRTSSSPGRPSFGMHHCKPGAAILRQLLRCRASIECRRFSRWHKENTWSLRLIRMKKVLPARCRDMARIFPASPPALSIAESYSALPCRRWTPAPRPAEFPRANLICRSAVEIGVRVPSRARTAGDGPPRPNPGEA